MLKNLRLPCLQMTMSPCTHLWQLLLELNQLDIHHLKTKRFIRPEDVPVQYGGLSRPSDVLNSPPKPASEFTIKGGEKVNIQIEGIEVGLKMQTLLASVVT